MLSRILIAASLIAGSAAAQATDTFNSSTNQLQIPSVQVGNTIFNNVVVQFNTGGFSVLSVGSAQPANSVAANCLALRFTPAIFNAIAVGMTLDQVDQTIGCQRSTNLGQRAQTYVSYVWVDGSGGLIIVYFDAAGSVVTPYVANTYKSGSGF
ncbi:MAG: hypothetical protein JO218_10945 [Burkholderiales bacterium]|nr:hypothetical protein [Burkholderiales bacterium]